MYRVVVTGMGVISPVGKNTEEFWTNLKNGVCGIDKIGRFDSSMLEVKLDAEVKDFNPKEYFDSVQEIRRADLYTQYAVAASKEAVEGSRIIEDGIDPERLGVYIGSGIGGITTTINEIKKFYDKGPDKLSAFMVPMMIGNMASGTVAIKYNAKAGTLPVVTACATSSHAIGEAYRCIKYGYADAIIAGGSEACLNEITVAGFTSCRALNTASEVSLGCIPFDKRRNGFVMGEGAAILVLEEYEHAVKRNATIYGEIVGYANTCDAHHITAPDPEGKGAIKAISDAMKEAGISTSDEIYINAHGTGTPRNDAMETMAIKHIFGDKAKDVSISSTKSMTGHMMGAAGAAESIACLMALRDGIIPPTINYREADPECDLDYTTNGKKERDIKYALSTSFGFGGHNACLAFKQFYLSRRRPLPLDQV